jgi:hypothetical protein
MLLNNEPEIWFSNSDVSHNDSSYHCKEYRNVTKNLIFFLSIHYLLRVILAWDIELIVWRDKIKGPNKDESAYIGDMFSNKNISDFLTHSRPSKSSECISTWIDSHNHVYCQTQTWNYSINMINYVIKA